MSEDHEERGCVIAIDVGGTGMKGALLDRGLKPLVTLHSPTPRALGPDAVVDEIATTLQGLARRTATP